MKTLPIAAVAALVAVPALAAGPTEPVATPIVEPAASPVFVDRSGWSGFYAGGQLGYADVDGDVAGGDTVDGYGGTYGVHAGYNWGFGNWVVGTELEYDWADIDLDGGPDGIDSIARLKLRAGYDLGQALLYATAGPAYANAEIGGSDFSDTGWFAGVGMGYQVTDQWVVGGELLAHEFDDFDGTGVDVNATTAALRASYRF